MSSQIGECKTFKDIFFISQEKAMLNFRMLRLPVKPLLNGTCRDGSETHSHSSTHSNAIGDHCPNPNLNSNHIIAGSSEVAESRMNAHVYCMHYQTVWALSYMHLELLRPVAINSCCF